MSSNGDLQKNVQTELASDLKCQGHPFNYFDDWQNKWISKKDRQNHLLQSGMLSDCKFQVGDPSDESKQKTFQCHKAILSMESPVFERMFDGSLAESSGTIIIPDVDSNAFAILLKYIYTKEFDVSTYGLSKAVELHYVGEKYMVSSFLKLFVEFLLSKDWDIQYIFAIGRFVNLTDEYRLKEKYFVAVQKEAKNLLMHETFMELDISELPSVIYIMNNNFSQLELFKGIEKYVNFSKILHNVKNLNIPSAICKSQDDLKIEKTVNERGKLSDEGTENSKSNLPCVTNEALKKDEFVAKWIIVQDLLKLIRFDEMTLLDFASVPAKSRLLDKNDIISIFTKLSQKHSNKIKLLSNEVEQLNQKIKPWKDVYCGTCGRY